MTCSDYKCFEIAWVKEKYRNLYRAYGRRWAYRFLEIVEHNQFLRGDYEL